MRTLLILTLLLFTMPAFSQQGILTDTYRLQIEQKVEELKALTDAGLATDRDTFMLEYYRKKLGSLNAEAAGSPHRAVFTTAIENKEPTNDIHSIAASIRQVSFFTELRNLNGKTATHRWSVAGQVVYSKNFKVGADRWRVWSTKTITPYKGKVVVVQILVKAK